MVKTKLWGTICVLALGACTAGDGLEIEGDGPNQYPGEASASASQTKPGPANGEQKQPPASTFACADKKGDAKDKTVTVTVANSKRTALLHVPKGYDATKGTSLALAFHGYGGNATGMRSQTHLDKDADARNFLVAYVQGIGIASDGFNGGDCCGQPAWIQPVDDVMLGREIVKAVSADYCVDPKRVYSAGFSNGGFMSYRFICEAADLFAAVVSVSGVLGIPPEKCKPARPVPLLHVHGTADPIVPFKGGGAAGGLGSTVGVTFRSVEASLATFRTMWSCGASSRPSESKGDTKCERWDGCKDQVSLELCTVTEGGHQWPGGEEQPLGGKVSKDLDTTGRVLDFFASHTLP